MAQPWAMGSTRARAMDGPSGASASSVFQSPIQKSSWRYSAAMHSGEVGAVAPEAATAGAMQAKPSAANAFRSGLRRSVSFMVLHSGEPVGGARVIHAARHDYSPDSDTIHLTARLARGLMH